MKTAMKAALFVVLLSGTPCWSQSNVKVLVAPPVGLDAQRQLGCKPGVDPTFSEGTNQSRLAAASTSNTSRFPPVIPGGDWEITNTIVLGKKWGTALRGAGGTVTGYGDDHFTSPTGFASAPQATRIIWKGADDGFMMRTNNVGFDLQNLTFQGCRVAGSNVEPTGLVYPNRAKIGLHIPTSNTEEAGTTAKCRLGMLAFWQVQVGILMGTNADDPGAASYTGQADHHADQVHGEHLEMQFPTEGEYNGAGTGVWIRNTQSVGNRFDLIRCYGNPAQVFWMERGGGTTVGQIVWTPNGSTLGWAVKVGQTDINTGGLLVGNVRIDPGGTNARLLQGGLDVNGDPYNGSYQSAPVVIQSASIPPACTGVPHVDVGPGTWRIENTHFLQAGSIRMTGGVEGSGKSICHVHLENCALLSCNIDDLVDVTGTGSSGAYILTWRNCRRYNGAGSPVHWGVPFEDSTSIEIDENPPTEIKSGSMPARLTFDGN